MNATTARLLRRIERLPMRKQVELLQQLDEDEEGKAETQAKDVEARKEALLKVSVWSEEDIRPIEETREWMNSWKPGSSWTRRL